MEGAPHHRSSRRRIIVAVALSLTLWFLALGVGNYLRVGVAYPWFFKAIHVGAGFALAMLLRAFGLSWIRVCAGVFAVSAVYETFEYLLTTPVGQVLMDRWVPWYGLPSVSVEETTLDFVRNFVGVALYFGLEQYARRLER